MKKIISIIIIIAGVAGGYAYWRHTKSQAGRVACTMEALSCPDGSFVGRSGPQCLFSPCPNQESFIGILRQRSDGFYLVMENKGPGGQEVSYVMPIVMKVTNVTGTLLGQKVRAFGSFADGNTLIIDRLEELPAPDNDPTLGEIGVEESKYVNGVRITLNAVVQDNRCPIDVTCIEAGAINTNVTLQSDTDKETRNMPSDEVPIGFDSYLISIEQISPPRVSHSEPDPKSYRLVFKVVPTTK